jgi:hypothetical protein
MGLTFVNLGLLAGGLFIAVPIILHLIMRRQPIHLEFPALRFLKQRRDVNTRRMRLRHLLLLLLRIAAIALLAFALARPSLQGSKLLSQEAPVAAVLIVDTSAKMDYRNANQSRLEVAKSMALEVLARLPLGSQAAIVDAAARQVQFAVDLTSARSQVERLAISPAARPLPGQLEAALEKFKDVSSEEMREEIYVFTDRTRSSWTSDAPTSAEQSLAAKLAAEKDVGLYLVDVGVERPQDYGLGAVQLNRQVLAQRSPLEIRVDLFRAGPPGERKVELLMTDASGSSQKRDEKLLTWNEQEATQVEFRLPELPPGVHQGVVQIAGEDNLSWNNRRYFTVDVRAAWPVLVVSPRQREAVYFTEAIAPSVLKDQARFACKTIEQTQLAEERMTDFAAVVLLDPQPMPVEQWEQLATFAKAGGAVAIFLGPAADRQRFNETVPRSLLPGELKFISRNDTFISTDNASHPAISRFGELGGPTPWSYFPIEKYWMLTDLDDATARIVSFANNDPAIVEKPVGKGLVVTMLTPVSFDPDPRRTRWNRLTIGTDPEPWPFVMLMNELMLYLVGSEDERLNYVAGDTAVLYGAGEELPPSVSLTSPDGAQSRADIDPTKGVMTFSSTDQIGNYRVRAGGTQSKFERGFSINLPLAATRLARLPIEELDILLGKDRYRIADDSRKIEREAGRGRVGQELFPYMMALVALALALEQVLANRFYRREA